MKRTITESDLLRCRPFWTWPALLPVDQDAEHTIAGCAIDRAANAATALARLEAGDFYDRRLWRVIEAAAAIPALPLRFGPTPTTWVELVADVEQLTAELVVNQKRLAAVAEITGEHPAWLTHVARQRMAVADDNGWYAHRLKVAAHARTQILELLTQLDHLGVAVANPQPNGCSSRVLIAVA